MSLRNVFRQVESQTTRTHTPRIQQARVRRPARPSGTRSAPSHTTRINQARAVRPSRPSSSPTASTSRAPTSGGSGRSSGGGGGGGGGGGLTSRTTSGGGGSSGGGKSASKRADQARRRARKAEEARQRQLEALRASIGALPLDPSLIASFAERQRAVQSALEAAQLMREQQGAQADLDFEQFGRQLDQRTGQAIGDLRGEAAARNLAFQPHFVGRGMRDIRDEAGEARTQAEQQRATFMAGLERMVNQARQQSASEMAAIARERARAQADHRGFINQQLGALNF